MGSGDGLEEESDRSTEGFRAHAAFNFKDVTPISRSLGNDGTRRRLAGAGAGIG